MAAMAKVLVLDDNADGAESLGLLLGLHGHEVRAVTTAKAAFDALADFTPDVCLLDIRMPEMNGYQVARRVRATLGPDVRVFALTAELEAADDPRSTVFDRVFFKPPDLGELLGAVAGTGH
jgi:CheY-like chemotaxis protein